MKQITEEDHLEKEWLKEAKNQTLETLPEFINHLAKDYEHDYGTSIKATVAAMLGTFYAFNKIEGFTGFQVGFIPWFMIDEFWGESTVGRKVINFENMLYPQYEEDFDKVISKETFKKLQREAFKLLYEDRMASVVKEHVKSIAAGKVPFGYKIKD